jgi:hypothetical protein
MPSLRSSSLVVCLLLVSAIASCEEPTRNDPDEKRARAVLDRTKTVNGTYALYSWNWVTIPGQEPTEEWSAEFHSGDKHRVETPEYRLIADCSLATGSIFEISSGKIESGEWVAGVSCGINTNKPILELDWVGPVRTEFGPAERVRIVDSEHIREYDVSPEGWLLASTYAENTPDAHRLGKTKAVKLERALPETNMFDPASLQKSFVPAEYRVAPTEE